MSVPTLPIRSHRHPLSLEGSGSLHREWLVCDPAVDDGWTELSAPTSNNLISTAFLAFTPNPWSQNRRVLLLCARSISPRALRCRSGSTTVQNRTCRAFHQVGPVMLVANKRKRYSPLVPKLGNGRITQAFQCDEKQPACSRCLRLNFKCVGSGQQRYKFREEKRFARPKNEKFHIGKDWAVASGQCHSAPPKIIAPATTKLRHMYIHIPPGTPAAGPSNELTRLTSAFVKTIKRSTDLRYNLWWSFGSYLEDVPGRLGTSEALDRAVDALTTLHMDFCTRRQASVEALAKYAQALRTMRVHLDDKVHAQSSNTLCAVMVLLVCQIFMGKTNQCWSGHAEGAALILKARKNFGPRDDFETKLFLSLRGSVVSLPSPSTELLQIVYPWIVHTNDATSSSKAFTTTESASPPPNGPTSSPTILTQTPQTAKCSTISPALQS